MIPDAPMPPAVAALPRDERGYPIPFFTAYVAGRPDLRVSDPHKATRCDQHNLCWVCGTTLGLEVAFIGGPLSMQNRQWADGPMHEACARYSAAVCPFLNGTQKRRNDANMPKTIAPEGFVMEKPPAFAIVFARKWSRDARTKIWTASRVTKVVWVQSEKQS